MFDRNEEDKEGCDIIMKISLKINLHLVLFVLAIAFMPSSVLADPLPSWNDGAAKTAIFSFVANVTNTSSQNYVEPSERIATFDNDGTLWCEYPDYVQSLFMLDKVRDMAPAHPEWNDAEPFKSIISGKRFATSNFSAVESMQIYLAVSANLTPDEYLILARDWLSRSNNSELGMPHTSCVYKPMLELMSYLKEKGFRIYIVTGGDEDFVRSFSEDVYAIPPEQVIGTALKLQYVENNSSCYLVKLPEILVVSDGQEKPKEIQQNIGLRPILAYGNSDGDIPMLKFATSGNRYSLGLLNLHDDPVREFAYDNTTAVGKLDRGPALAGQWGWQVVSMKDDWKAVF